MNGIVYSLRFFLNISIVFTLTFACLVRAEDPIEPQKISKEANRLAADGSLVIHDLDPSKPDLNVDFQTKIVEPEDAEVELTKALVNSSVAETVVVSTDEVEVLKQAAKGADDRVVLLPFGKAIRKSADMANGINRLLRGSGAYLAQAFKKDKIGFGIATFTLGNEIVRWIHVSTASNFVISSNIVYSILWSSFFVDKDTWSKATKPLQMKFRKLFGLSLVVPATATFADTSIKFLAGLSLSMILNTGRAGLVGIDQLAHHVFDPLNLSMPYVMGAVMTAVGFSWSELMGSIDEKSFPRAKKITRLVMNSRSCVISYFAASAMLMNPEHYGIVPWVVVSVSGVTGLALYSTAKKWLPLLERGPRCESLFAAVPGL